MRVSRRIVVLGVLVAGLALAVGPAAVGSQSTIDPPSYDQINLFPGFGPPATFTADDPFYVRHGWGEIDQREWQGRNDFKFYLFIDGAQIEPTYVGCVSPLSAEDPGIFCRTFLFDFPEGLEAGVHTFDYMWLGPCAWQYDECLDDQALIAFDDLVHSEEIEFVVSP